MGTADTVYLILMVILTPISVAAMVAVGWWFVRQAKTPDRVEQIWQQRQQWGQERCRQLINRQVEAGMTPAMVRLAWGEPQAVERLAQGERWLYKGQSYVTFEGEQVTERTGQPPGREEGLNPWLVIGILLGLAVFVSGVAIGVVLMASR